MTKIDPRKKWVGPLLTASIIVNVFLAGFVVARLGAPDTRSEGNGEAPVIQMSLRSLPQDMPREVRERLEDEIGDRQADLDDAYRELQRARARAFTLLSEDDFDRERIEDAFQQLRQQQEQLQQQMNQAMIDAARRMSAESRRYFSREDLRRARSIRRADRVDGGRWSFSMDGGRFVLDLEALEELGLENLSDLQIVIGNPDQIDEHDREEWWDDEDSGYYGDDNNQQENQENDDDPDGRRSNFPLL
jgi:uncharacterized membrane protein